MLSTALALSLISTQDSFSRFEPESASPQSALAAVRQAAKAAGFKILIPKMVPAGFTLKIAEVSRGSLTERKASGPCIHLGYSSDTAKASFDILESPSISGLTPSSHMASILNQQWFSVGIEEGDTSVFVQKGGVDIGFAAGFFSRAAANKVVDSLKPLDRQ